MKFLGIYVGHKTQNKWLMVLCLVLVVWWIFLIRNHAPPREGFAQDDKFLVRRQMEMYDTFLAQIYDRIFDPKSLNQSIFDMVEKMTLPDTEKSVLLDAGTGTGELVQYMNSKGYAHAFGIDQSPDMVAMTMEKYPEVHVKVGDLSLPMTYDKHTFTHILMTGNTVYHFFDKIQLLRNLYYWLIPHGFLVLQVCDRERFDPIPSVGKPTTVDSLQSLVRQRVTDTEIDFMDFVYQSTYDFSRASRDNTVLFQETFTDAHTRNVRQNELTLYMEPLDEILYMAQYAGFLVHGQVNLKESGSHDEHQFVFILQRPN